MNQSVSWNDSRRLPATPRVEATDPTKQSKGGKKARGKSAGKFHGISATPKRDTGKEIGKKEVPTKKSKSQDVDPGDGEAQK